MARLLLNDSRRQNTESRQGAHVKYTHYDYLDLPPGADSARIETAYLALLERLQYGVSEAGQDLSGLIRRIHAAYDVLSNAERRSAYDASLAEEAAQADKELRGMRDQPTQRAQRFVQEAPVALVKAIKQAAA
jgi:curved DNA-binding protein CbpA